MERFVEGDPPAWLIHEATPPENDSPDPVLLDLLVVQEEIYRKGAIERDLYGQPGAATVKDMSDQMIRVISRQQELGMNPPLPPDFEERVAQLPEQA